VAADLARRRYAHREAVALLQHAAGLVSRLPEPDRVDAEIAVLEQLGMFYVALVNIPAALETYKTLVALAARHARIDVEIRALLDMALPAAWTSTQLSVETNERALELSASQEDPLMRARTRASCLLTRAVTGRWRAEDAESCREALEEIEAKADRRVVAEHRLGYTILQSQSSQYGEAHRKAIGSIAILLEQDDLNPYFGVLYQTHRYWLPVNDLLWGNWGQALEEVRETIALIEKNGENARGQEHLLIVALVHLCAMDFSGVVAICESIFSSVRIPMAIRQWHIQVGSAEAALGNHDRALEYLMKVKDEMDRRPLMNDWYNRMPLQAGLTELWLSKGDLASARQEAKRFLEVAQATAERTYQGLAWEANARVAIAGKEWKRAEDCIAKALSTIEGYEVPLAAWRIHGTAADLLTRAGNNDLADHHCELSRATITKLADSLGAEDSLRATFLSAPLVRTILDKAEGIGA
jgi:tetratricopeptide (TPR) repeat protein